MRQRRSGRLDPKEKRHEAAIRCSLNIVLGTWGCGLGRSPCTHRGPRAGSGCGGCAGLGGVSPAVSFSDSDAQLAALGAVQLAFCVLRHGAYGASLSA